MQSKVLDNSEITGGGIDYWQVLKNRYGVILLTFLLVFMTAAVITSVMPRKYQSSTVVQVHPSMITITPTRNGSRSQPGTLMTANYMENEFETIIAPKTLEEAALALGLPGRWEMDIDKVVDLSLIHISEPTRPY